MKTEDTATAGTQNDPNGAFTIAATGKAFRILSDGLYSDKITAVIRELSCNAYDSHVAVGKGDTPFEVHLPMDTEPYFSVTDFGTGISDSDIHGIYTRYFASTKTNSNEFIGQLGLGSKSPFSLVREFRVESRHQSVSRTYRMYFDDTDTPRVELLFEGPAERDGLTVKFDVPSYSDRRRFAERADAVLGWFTTIPNITGNTDVRIHSRIGSMGSDGWFLRPRTSYTVPPVALMGNVAYPIDHNSIEGINDDMEKLLELPIVIRFGIGDLEVSASRESLGYDKRTVHNIKQRCVDVLAEFKAQQAGLIAACATEWLARKAYDDLLGYDAPHRWQLMPIFKDHDITWNGIKIDSQSKKVDLTAFYDQTKSGYRAHTGHAGKMVLDRVAANELGSFSQRCTKEDLVVFNDCERGGLNRIKHWLKNELKTGRVTVYDAPASKTWADLKSAIGDPEIKLSSELPVPPRKASAGRGTMMEFKGSSWNKTSWADVEIDMDEGGYYINTARKDPVLASGHTVNLGDMIKDAVACGLIPNTTKVYAPKGPMIKKITKLENWVNIGDHLASLVRANINDGMIERSSTTIAWEDVRYRNKQLFGCAWNLRDKDGTMARFLSLSEEMQSITSDQSIARFRRMCQLGSRLNIKIDLVNPDPRIKTMVDEVDHRYPLLGMLQDRAWTNGTSVTSVLDYVNMVDQNHVWYALSEPVPEETEED